jgi:hypothetical protein
VIVRLDHLSEVFEGGKLELELKDAAHALASLTGINERSTYGPALMKLDRLPRAGK